MEIAFRMKSIIGLFLLGMTLCLFVPVSSAQNLGDININKAVFNYGDRIVIDMAVFNDLNKPLYLQYIISGANAPAISNSLKVNPYESKVFILINSTIGADFRNSDYMVFVRLADEFGNEIYSIRNSSFKVDMLSTEFDFILKTCADSLCQSTKKVFTKGENVYLDYSSSVENPLINAKLAYPDGTSKNINLPYSFKAGQIGTYNLDVSAAKQGYNNVSKQEIFGVIEKQAEINSIDENGNEVSSGENSENKVSILIDKIKEFSPFSLIIALAVVIGIISLIVILYLTRKKGIKERDEPYI